jgi:hypothetical protein
MNRRQMKTASIVVSTPLENWAEMMRTVIYWRRRVEKRLFSTIDKYIAFDLDF